MRGGWGRSYLEKLLFFFWRVGGEVDIMINPGQRISAMLTVYS